MQPAIETTVAGLRAWLSAARLRGARIGFVPTMGCLHAGHKSLMLQAAADNDLVVVSIFVNPLQFNPGEDFDDYPRDMAHDLEVCASAGVDLVFAPDTVEMFPTRTTTNVSVRDLADVLCGAARPGHFDGVATVVAKLFGLVGDCVAYFGEKDFQQLSIIRTMTSDLSMPVTVVGCPTVRESDGLALSSRNAYLNQEQRQQAPVLKRALNAGAALLADGVVDPGVVVAAMKAVMATAPAADVEYAAAVSASTLRAESPLSGAVRLLVAARFGRARLIDNLACHTH